MFRESYFLFFLSFFLLIHLDGIIVLLSAISSSLLRISSPSATMPKSHVKTQRDSLQSLVCGGFYSVRFTVYHDCIPEYLNIICSGPVLEYRVVWIRMDESGPAQGALDRSDDFQCVDWGG